MTDEMLALARDNQRTSGVGSRFLRGEIETSMPTVPWTSSSPTASSLSADKDRVLRGVPRAEAGGRLAVSDVVVRGEVLAAIRKSVELWIGCVAGALGEHEYRLGRIGAARRSIARAPRLFARAFSRYSSRRARRDGSRSTTRRSS